jgi:hypothetical protein
MSQQDGGPAFPTIQCDVRNFPDGADLSGSMGLSLRDYFAAATLPTALSFMFQAALGKAEHVRLVAAVCYQMADALLDERAKEKAP